MMVTDTLLVTIVRETCCNCGVVFGLEAKHRERLLGSHGSFYCPNGHGQHYLAQTEAEHERALRGQAERALAATREQRDRAFTREAVARRSLIATRGVVTRIKNRVGRGVCPCCNRTFQNLASHMAGQHPDFAEAR